MHRRPVNLWQPDGFNNLECWYSERVQRLGVFLESTPIRKQPGGGEEPLNTKQFEVSAILQQQDLITMLVSGSDIGACTHLEILFII